MSQFYLIAGTGHCGTKWLAEALDQPNAGIVCAHEGKVPKPVNWRSHLKKIGPLAKLWSRYRGKFRSFQGTNPWLEYQEYEMKNGIGPKYDLYFQDIASNLKKYNAVGDSHSWPPHFIPEVNERVHVDRVVYLVRNGVQTVNSLANANSDLPEDHSTYRYLFPIYEQLFGGSCSSVWEYWCYWWSINLHAPSWLSEKLPATTVEILRLEDLTSHTSELEQLIESLSPGGVRKVHDLEQFRSKDLNRKSSGDRDPQVVWDQWTLEKREVFARICGPAMVHFGYWTP